MIGSTKPGLPPRRHLKPIGRSPRSTKAGASTPATHCWVDGVSRSTKASTPTRVRVQPLRCLRSTKAGASTPATPARGRRSYRGLCIAQRRPGLPPRRHRLAPDCHYGAWRRPAQRRPGLPPRRHEVYVGSIRWARVQALNEGRGFHPGDTSQTVIRQRRPGLRDTSRSVDGGPVTRSTKAGASTPATLLFPHRRQKRGRDWAKLHSWITFVRCYLRQKRGLASPNSPSKRFAIIALVAPTTRESAESPEVRKPVRAPRADPTRDPSRAQIGPGHHQASR